MKIILKVGLVLGVIYVILIGLYKNEINKYSGNPIEYYRTGFLREGIHAELHMAAYNGDKEKVLSLLENGHDIHVKKTSFKFTPFHTAVFNGQIETADLLLSKGAKIDARSNFNQTPLHWAAFMGEEEAVEFLIQKGASLEEMSEHGWTAIHFASRIGHLNIVKILINKGAQKDKKTPEGETAEDVAKSFNQEEVARYLASEL